MTAFQVAALLAPALIAMVLFVMAAFVRRQNTAPAAAAPSSDEAENLKRDAADAQQRAIAQMARLQERVAAESVSDAELESFLRSIEIDRKLDLITDLLRSRIRAT